MAVVIPARDEEERIVRCVRSVMRAVRELDRMHPSVAAEVIVVADGCTDETARYASAEGARVIERDASGVGATRAAGIAVAGAGGVEAQERLWLANTDADSVVPANWLTYQFGLAERGIGMMIGTVRPEPQELTAAQNTAWRQSHVRGRPNGHVHGANLGIRADVYSEAGGFDAIDCHEDALLVQRIRLSGARIVASDRCEVLTSARRANRVPGGYAAFLHGELTA